MIGVKFMQWFANMRTGYKLSLSFALIVLIMFFILWTFYKTIIGLEEHNKKLSTIDLVVLEGLASLRDDQSDLQSYLFKSIIETDQAELEKLKDKMKSKIEEIRGDIQNVVNTEQDNPIFMEKFLAITKALEEIYDRQMNKMEPLIFSGKIDEAKTIVNQISFPQNEKTGDQIIALIDDVRKNIDTTISQLNSEIKSAIELFMS